MQVSVAGDGLGLLTPCSSVCQALGVTVMGHHTALPVVSREEMSCHSSCQTISFFNLKTHREFKQFYAIFSFKRELKILYKGGI